MLFPRFQLPPRMSTQRVVTRIKAGLAISYYELLLKSGTCYAVFFIGHSQRNTDFVYNLTSNQG
jgi:hypothetical protein